MASLISPSVDVDPAARRILVVDDSVVVRAVMDRIIGNSGQFVVANSVGTAAAALKFLATERVDFILLDIQMPGIDGLTALPDMIAAGQGAKVLVVSSQAGDGGSVTVQALALGAADTLAKPGVGGLLAGFAGHLIDKLTRLSAPVPVVAHLPAPRTAASPAGPPPLSAGALSPSPASPYPLPATPMRRAMSGEFEIVGIGASTGGIHALSHMLRAIPSDFQLPIVITQHLPASFMPYFAAQLAVLGGRPCDVATDGMRIRRGRMIVAPGDAHLRCVALANGSAAIRLTHEPVTTGCMPSVDPMLTSMASVYGSRMLAVILSGMGRDGSEGAAQVRAAGGCVVVQDQESSVIWGMPGAVANAGSADAMMTPEAIGRLAASGRRP